MSDIAEIFKELAEAMQESIRLADKLAVAHNEFIAKMDELESEAAGLRE